MATRIDTSVIMRLIATQLETLSGPDVLQPGEPPSEDLVRWCRMESLSLTQQQTVNDGADRSTLSFSIRCACRVNPEAGSVYAIAATVELVRAKYYRVGLTDQATTHQLVATRSSVSIETDDEQPLLMLATVAFDGEALRQTGDTIESHSPTA